MDEITPRERDVDEHYDRRSKNSDEIFCSSCGAIIKKEAEICPKCGVRQKSAIPQTVPFAGEVVPRYLIKSRSSAGILALLLGGFGVHKFYLGQIGMGILYLLFFWTCIPVIVGLIEGILYLTSTDTDEEFTRKYVLKA